MAVLTMMARCPAVGVLLRRWASICLALGCCMTAAVARAADGAPSVEYQLKAVFLFNFAQFVEWPARAFPEPTSPLVIGVLGDDPFGAYLDDLVKDETVGRRRLIVRRYKRVSDIAECHILFVSGSEADALDQIVGSLKGRSILTVSDLPTFTRQGGMVRFVTEEGRIRLRISVVAAKASGLTISSKILRPDMIVTPGKD